MLTLGIDIGAATAKAVIMHDSKIIGSCFMPTGYNVKIAIHEVVKRSKEQAGLDDVTFNCIVSTGYGRSAVLFADKQITEILCHARGVNFMIPAARSIIDIGGQDSKVILIDDKGNVLNFIMNDKCAAGTGRFLEVMANVLGIKIEEMGPLALTSKDPCEISSTCTIFAETEMVSLRAQERSREDLLAGIVKAVAWRVALMGTNIGFKREVVFTGGVAKNVGVKAALEKKINMPILTPEEPTLTGAIGAALLGVDEAIFRKAKENSNSIEN